MLLHRGVPMLAAALTLAGGAAPAAYGFDNRASPASTGGRPAALVEHHPGGSSDLLIGAGVAAGSRSSEQGWSQASAGTRRAASRTARVPTTGRA